MKFCSVVLILISFSFNLSISQQNVTDRDFEDRILELSMATPWDMIRSYKYPVENLNLTTEDGYFINIQRIPYGRNGKKSRKPPVLIVSGLLVSTAIWLFDENELAYKLADLGYDVWLLNNRGMTYSVGHESLSVESSEYWNFSYHEMGLYDVPNTMDYILKRTRHKSLYLIGYSQGGTSIAIMLSKRPEYNEKVRLSIHMAPAFYESHINRLLKMIVESSIYTHLETFISNYGYFGVFQNMGLLQKFFANEFCGNPSFSRICATVAMYTVGPNFPNLDLKKLPILLSHFPAGASVKQLAHFGHTIKTGLFEEYDIPLQYDKTSPKITSSKSKLYNISLISSPTAVLYGRNDWLTPKQDVERSIDQFPNLVMKHPVDDIFFNHLDFIVGNNRGEMLDPYVIALLDKF